MKNMKVKSLLQKGETKLPLILFVIIMMAIASIITISVSNLLTTKEIKTNSNASEKTNKESVPSDENPSDPKLPYQVVTAMPLPTLAETDPSQLSPNECQARGGTCIYDLSCGDFNMTKIAECNGVRPANGLPIDCCKR